MRTCGCTPAAACGLVPAPSSSACIALRSAAGGVRLRPRRPEPMHPMQTTTPLPLHTHAGSPTPPHGIAVLAVPVFSSRLLPMTVRPRRTLAWPLQGPDRDGRTRHTAAPQWRTRVRTTPSGRRPGPRRCCRRRTASQLARGAAAAPAPHVATCLQCRAWCLVACTTPPAQPHHCPPCRMCPAWFLATQPEQLLPWSVERCRI